MGRGRSSSGRTWTRGIRSSCWKTRCRPAIQPVWDAEFMKKYADVRAADFARFLALAKKGGPYERHMVIEDVPGNTAPPLTAALTYQQREHMERGVEYCKKVLDLGVRWRG